MTVPYNNIMNGNFVSFKTLFKWRGSLYKLIWIDFLIFMIIHTIIQLSYSYLLNDKQQAEFENVVTYFSNRISYIPLSFLFGFYIFKVIDRFFKIFNLLPYPYELAMYLNAAFPNNDERSLMYKRTIIRYGCVSLAIVLRNISSAVHTRFPSPTFLVDTKLLTVDEITKLESYNVNGNYGAPLASWGATMTIKAREEGLIYSDQMANRLINAINDVRGQCGGLSAFDSANLPLSYSQIVELARSIYCIVLLLANYDFGSYGTAGDANFPLLTIFQIIIYTGWLKIATAALNPFGNDDDDLDCDDFIDRFLCDGMLCVDGINKSPPDLLNDFHWGINEFEIPYTDITTKSTPGEYIGSAEATVVTDENQNIVEIDISDKVPDTKINMSTRPAKVSVYISQTEPAKEDDSEDDEAFKESQSKGDIVLPPSKQGEDEITNLDEDKGKSEEKLKNE